MLTTKDLDGVKLVNEEYIATIAEAQQMLETVFQQASQGWGVRREAGVILRLARDLRISLAISESADEAQRMLKGAQMELGRVKKQRDEAVANAANLQTIVDVLEKSLQNQEKSA